MKLAKELVKKSTGKTLYLLDEPTTGLHFADIKQLLAVLHNFVKAGNTVLAEFNGADSPGGTFDFTNPSQLDVAVDQSNGHAYVSNIKGHGVVDEFDGAGKYRDPTLLKGRTPEQILMAADPPTPVPWARAIRERCTLR